MFADVVFVNGQVISVDSDNRILEAVAVKRNRIEAVGTNEEIKHWIGERTKVIDLQGRSLLPGFIDSHLHLIGYGRTRLAINCKDASIQSNVDIIGKLQRKAVSTPAGSWIVATGYNERAMLEGRYLTRHELDDEVSTEHPILIIRTCGHIMIANSKALELAGVNEQSVDPEGGVFGRDESRRLNGLLVEAAMDPVKHAMNPTEQDLARAAEIASRDFVSLGITTIHDAGGFEPVNMRILQQSVRSGRLKVRVYAMVVHEPNFNRMRQTCLSTGLGDERFRIGPAKIFIDGASSVPTLATRQPYETNPEDSGILYYTQENMNDALIAAHRDGYQITAHAQGDWAIEMLLNTFEEALRQYPRDNHRHRIEHAGLAMPDLIERMAKLGIVTVPNPNFFTEFGDIYIKHFGARRDYFYPIGSCLKAGIVVAGASDSPVSNCNPLIGIHGAVNRLTPSGTVVGEEQKISVMEAIRMYTWSGAYASFEEDRKGSIEVGKLADLVVLNDRILDVTIDSIDQLRVEMTMIDGEIVYELGKSPDADDELEETVNFIM
ncbi:amidohydrolase [Peribacillus aracenensis]|uniref:amidohydrolase n=1 Tax=Peribacillus aracenensis TaxID=2976708 RepID=UPI0021A6F0FE|nr:amidohydrolase [Peribacillus sp. BBB004]